MILRMTVQPETTLVPPPAPASLVTLAQIKSTLEAIPVSRLPEVYAYLLQLQAEALEDAEDHAIVLARRDEPSRPFDEFVQELGFTPDELAAARRSEGLSE